MNRLYRKRSSLEKALGIGSYSMYFSGGLDTWRNPNGSRNCTRPQTTQETFGDMDNAAQTVQGSRPILVWDPPTRLFHWLLVALVTASFASGKIGGNAMWYHERCGEAILALLIFRLMWGFIGSTPSRFRTFLAGPSTVVRYALTLFQRESDHHLSHNPLGGWSVVAMLLVLFVQAGTGLFANDDIATEGPLYKWVSKAASDRLTSIHRLNHDVIIILVAVHVAAVLFHLIYKRENLITPMITGIKQWREDSAEAAQQSLWLAAGVAAVAAAAVYFLVR
jgi:cytochrome b